MSGSARSAPVSAWPWCVCLWLLMGNASVALAGALADELLKPGRAADPAQVPVLRVLDEAGQMRWQVPVALWAAHREELGGFAYPCQIPVDRPFELTAPLVLVGYGLSRHDWDDYAGQRIEGAIAVVFTGGPQRSGRPEPASKEEGARFTREVQDKVANARAHGAVAVLLERDPSLPPCQEDSLFFPARLEDIPMASSSIWPYSAGELALPTFSIGTRTLEAVTALSSELFTSCTTPASSGLRMLTEEAVRQGKALGPVPLHLHAQVSWKGGQLRKGVGRRCDVWYQPGAAATQDIDGLVRACDSTLESTEKLLAARVEKRVTLLLFPEWRSKLLCTQSLGGGISTGSRVAMIYERGGDDAKGTLVHELCHVVAESQANPPAAFNEGLARLMGDTLGDLTVVQSGDLRADGDTAANLREGKLWTLRELLAIPQSEWGLPARRPAVSYPEAASFCAYLIRRVGFAGFRDTYRMLGPDDMDRNVQVIEHAIGQDLGAIEADWHAYLRGVGR